LIVVIVIAVITVLGFALLKLGSSENDAVASKRHYDQSVSCAEAAREVLLSQFRAYGASPTSITLDQEINGQQVGTGHYDQIGVTSVVAAQGFQQSSFGASDMSNRIQRAGLGGQVYRMTVACRGGTGANAHQSEVEFVVRFGL
jgi:hypothetical protein